jgi:hypothetical protein
VLLQLFFFLFCFFSFSVFFLLAALSSILQHPSSQAGFSLNG